MSEDQGADKRKSQRVRLNRRVWCEGDGLTLYLPAVNVSAGGFFLRTATPLRRGALVRLDVEIEPEETVSAECEVVWTRPPGEPFGTAPGMGLRITRVLEGGDALERFLQRAGREDSGSFRTIARA